MPTDWAPTAVAVRQSAASERDEAKASLARRFEEIGEAEAEPRHERDAAGMIVSFLCRRSGSGCCDLSIFCSFSAFVDRWSHRR
jgi:hypothetical protein